MAILQLISGIIICQLITYYSKFTFSLNKKYLKSFPPNFLFQIYLGICSLILIFIFHHELNFKISLQSIWEIIYQTFFLFFISFLIINSIIDKIEKKYSIKNGEETKGFDPPNKSIFMLMVMFINPLTEELLYRGFFLNHISSLNHLIIETNFITLSAPMILSGLYFGLDHLTLLKNGMDKYFVSKIVFGGIIVGITCSYHQINHDSFSAAVIAHFMANLTSGFSSFLSNKFKLK